MLGLGMLMRHFEATVGLFRRLGLIRRLATGCTATTVVKPSSGRLMHAWCPSLAELYVLYLCIQSAIVRCCRLQAGKAKPLKAPKKGPKDVRTQLVAVPLHRHSFAQT
jgi:hypothetical protein